MQLSGWFQEIVFVASDSSIQFSLITGRMTIILIVCTERGFASGLFQVLLLIMLVIIRQRASTLRVWQILGLT
ncbi:MAG: hypothetical protein C0607_15310 [Azoarcus sp.]|nr:MAG: hypothetical protein C0607_15310 [Azoarcus sp.]